jgi:hypothetical protein
MSTSRGDVTSREGVPKNLKQSEIVQASLAAAAGSFQLGLNTAVLSASGIHFHLSARRYRFFSRHHPLFKIIAIYHEDFAPF